MQTAILIDGENIRYGAKATGMRFDYRALFEFVKQRYQIVSASYFTIYMTSAGGTNTRGQDTYLQHFNSVSKKVLGLPFHIYQVHPKIYRGGVSVAYTCPDCGHGGKAIKDRCDGDLDVHIAIEALRLAYGRIVDNILLLSGDNHFTPMVRLLSHLGVSTEVVADLQSTAGELKSAAHAFYPLSQFLAPKAIPATVAPTKSVYAVSEPCMSRETQFQGWSAGQF